MKYAYKSIVGKRKHNEDSVCVREVGSGLLLIVADGMGGHAAGDVASRMVAEGLAEDLGRLAAEADPANALHQSIRRVNLEVFRAAQASESCRGMGSTLVCALADEARFIAANVGDSRLYHFDGNRLSRVTADHSLVEALVREGKITPEEALVHPLRNVITRAVGTGLHVDADIFTGAWQAGDLLLLCTDGLHGSLDDGQISELLKLSLPLDALCDTLVGAASDAGSRDNITVVLARCEGGLST